MGLTLTRNVSSERRHVDLFKHLLHMYISSDILSDLCLIKSCFASLYKLYVPFPIKLALSVGKLPGHKLCFASLHKREIKESVEGIDAVFDLGYTAPVTCACRSTSVVFLVRVAESKHCLTSLRLSF